MNQGMKQALKDGCEYVCLLNDDTLVYSNWLSDLQLVFNFMPKVGIVSPLTDYSAHAHQDIKYCPYHIGKLINTHVLMFVCVMLKKEVIEKVGFLDEDFKYGGYEDNDYCLRAKIKGYQLVVNGNVFVHHYGERAASKLPIDYGENLKKNKEIFKKKWKLNSIEDNSWYENFFSLKNSGAEIIIKPKTKV